MTAGTGSGLKQWVRGRTVGVNCLYYPLKKGAGGEAATGVLLQSWGEDVGLDLEELREHQSACLFPCPESTVIFKEN